MKPYRCCLCVLISLVWSAGCYTHTLAIPGTLDLRPVAAVTSSGALPPLAAPNVGMDAVIDGAGLQRIGAVAPGVERFSLEHRGWWALGFFPSHQPSLTSPLSDVLATSNITNLTIMEQVTGTDAVLYALSKSVFPLSLGLFWTTPTFTVTVTGTRQSP